MRPRSTISHCPIVALLMALLLFCPLARAEISAAGANDQASPTQMSPASTVLTPAAPGNSNSTVNGTFSHRHLSLAECFLRADNNNKEILVAACDLPVAEAAIVIARALPNPTYNMTYGWGPAWQYIIAGNNQSFGASQELLVAGRRTKRAGVAKASYLCSALKVEALRFDVHIRVRRAYAELAAAAAYEDLIEAQREIALKLLDVSRKRNEAGKAPGSELILARLAVMQFDAQKNQARGRLVQGSARLAQLIGEIATRQEIIDVDENAMFGLSVQSNALVPDAGRTLPALLRLLPVAWTERKDLQAAIQQAFVARKALTLAKTQRIPDPVLGFSYQPTTYKKVQSQYFSPSTSASNTPSAGTAANSLSSGASSGSLPDSGNSAASSGNSGSASASSSSASGAGSVIAPPDKVPYQPGYLLTVNYETPIFYQYQGQVEQAKSAWLQQLKQNDSLHAQIANDIVLAYESVQLTRDNIFKFQQDLLPAAARVAQLSRRGYELGKLDLGAAMLAQQQYQQTRSAYFDSVSSYQNAWADLEKAVGVTLKL